MNIDPDGRLTRNQKVTWLAGWLPGWLDLTAIKLSCEKLATRAQIKSVRMAEWKSLGDCVLFPISTVAARDIFPSPNPR